MTYQQLAAEAGITIAELRARLIGRYGDMADDMIDRGVVDSGDVQAIREALQDETSGPAGS